MIRHLRRPSLSGAARIAAIAVAIAWAAAPVAQGENPGLTMFWKPWFLNLGGGSPGPDAPFLELSGKLQPGTPLCFQCWGLQPTDEVRLVVGNSLDLLPGPGSGVLVPHPELILPVPLRTFDDDGPAGPLPSYSVMQFAVPIGPVIAASPGACFQVWIKQGPDQWTASNAVAASFDIAELYGP